MLALNTYDLKVLLYMNLSKFIYKLRYHIQKTSHPKVISHPKDIPW